jgi:hypothetical protein
MDCRTHYGTAHFVSTHAALTYYRKYGFDAADVQRKLRDGEIAIGEPKQPDGSPYANCVKGTDGRYWIRF